MLGMSLHSVHFAPSHLTAWYRLASNSDGCKFKVHLPHQSANPSTENQKPAIKQEAGQNISSLRTFFIRETFLGTIITTVITYAISSFHIQSIFNPQSPLMSEGDLWPGESGPQLPSEGWCALLVCCAAASVIHTSEWMDSQQLKRASWWVSGWGGDEVEAQYSLWCLINQRKCKYIHIKIIIMDQWRPFSERGKEVWPLTQEVKKQYV